MSSMKRFGCSLIGSPYGGIAVWFEAKSGDLRGAVSDLKESFRLRPDADSMIKAATALVSLGDRKQARECLSRALQHASESARAHLRIGMLLLQLGRREDGAKRLSEAVRLGANDPFVQFHASRKFVELGDHASALAAATRSVQRDPKNLAARRIATQSALQLRKPDVAERHLIEVMKRSPDDPLANLLLARVFDLRREWTKALVFYRECIREDPKDARSRMGAGNCLRELGEHAAAAEHMKAAVELAPTRAIYRAEFAWQAVFRPESEEKAIIEAGRHARALARRFPENAWFQTILAMAHGRLGRWEQALATVEEGVELTADTSPKIRLCVAIVHARLEDLAAARREFAAAGRIDAAAPADVRSLRAEAAGLLGADEAAAPDR